RETVGCGMRKRGQAVQKARCGNCQADAGLPGQKAGNRRGIACVLLVAERQHADAGGLRHPTEISDRNAGNAVNRVDAVELERIDDKVKTVSQFLIGGARCLGFLRGIKHGLFSLIVVSLTTSCSALRYESAA